MAESQDISLEFTKKLLELTTSTWVDEKDFEPFVELVGIPPGAPKVDFLQRFIALLKRLPEKLVDREAKERMITAGQTYLEKAIEEEESLSEE